MATWWPTMYNPPPFERIGARSRVIHFGPQASNAAQQPTNFTQWLRCLGDDWAYGDQISSNRAPLGLNKGPLAINSGSKAILKRIFFHR